MSRRRWGGSVAVRLRDHWRPLVEAGQAACWRCGLPIRPGSSWHVGHLLDSALGGSDDVSNTHPEHARCNTSAGGRLAAQLRRAATGKRTRKPAPIAAATSALLADRQAARPDWSRR